MLAFVCQLYTNNTYLYETVILRVYVSQLERGGGLEAGV